MRIIVLVLLCVLTGCAGGGSSGGPGRTPAAPSTGTVPTGVPLPAGPASPGGAASPGVPPRARASVHSVTFTIRGSVRSASVTYTTPAGRRHLVVRPPWTLTFTADEGASVDVVARSTDGGELSCALKVDGEVLKSALSSGDSATVDCGDGPDR